MICRVCGQEISKSRYCYVCGWLNGEVELLTSTLQISRTADAIGIVQIKNLYNSEVDVNVKINDTTGTVAFIADGITQLSNSTNISKIVSSGETADIKVSFNLRNLGEINNLHLKLSFETNDNSPKFEQHSFYKRPYKRKQIRKWERDVFVEILEPSRLSFDKHMIIFDANKNQRTINITNIGRQDISLNKGSFNIAPGFEVILEGGNDSIKIGAGSTTLLNIKQLQTNLETENVMTITYMAESERISQDILLHCCKTISEIPNQLCHKVVAVDFGTCKTVSAYLDILDLETMDCLSKEIKMINLEDTGYETPSCINYIGRREYVGVLAEGQRNHPDAEFISSMKMHLHDDIIKIQCGSVVKERKTQDVITSYLSHIKDRIYDEISIDNNKYIFTLPVLDNDQDGVMFKKQKELTLACAQAAGFGDSENIYTITEPEAAMYYIINSIRDNPEKWSKCSLQSGDMVCVFDYGGGTLDICFGVYKLNGGKPTVENTISIGTYFNEENIRISLGGDRLDNRISLLVCSEHQDIISLKNQKTDEHGYFSAEFADDSKYKHSSWLTFTDAIKNLKEDLSTKWDNIGDEGITIDKDSEIALTKDIFSDTVYEDIQYAIDSMKKAIIHNHIETPKYIFMVGGTSLIKIIKMKLQKAFPSPRTTVLNAYDYSDYNGDGGDYSNIRQDAIYPVVRGAAVSYMTTVSQLLSIYFKIAPLNHQDNPNCYISYNKDESFYSQEKVLNSQICWGEWIVTGSVDGTNYHKIGTFNLEKPSAKSPIALTLIIKITKDREVKIFYRYGNEVAEHEVPGIDIYI